MKGVKSKQLGVAVDSVHFGMVFIPTTNKQLANAKVLEVFEDGFTVHRKSNYNEDGDFSTELMRFDNNFMFDKQDLEKRNEFRLSHGLIKI